MESNVLTSIPGIEYYPIISLVMFFVLFAGLLIWFFRSNPGSSQGERLDAFAREVIDDEESYRSDLAAKDKSSKFNGHNTFA